MESLEPSPPPVVLESPKTWYERFEKAMESIGVVGFLLHHTLEIARKSCGLLKCTRCGDVYSSGKRCQGNHKSAAALERESIARSKPDYIDPVTKPIFKDTRKKGKKL